MSPPALVPCGCSLHAPSPVSSPVSWGGWWLTLRDVPSWHAAVGCCTACPSHGPCCAPFQAPTLAGGEGSKSSPGAGTVRARLGQTTLVPSSSSSACPRHQPGVSAAEMQKDYAQAAMLVHVSIYSGSGVRSAQTAAPLSSVFYLFPHFSICLSLGWSPEHLSHVVPSPGLSFTLSSWGPAHRVTGKGRLSRIAMLKIQSLMGLLKPRCPF